jgi:hypothetical protein
MEHESESPGAPGFPHEAGVGAPGARNEAGAGARGAQNEAGAGARGAAGQGAAAGLGETGGQPAVQRHGTGEPRVDAALARLDELGRRPVTEHRAIFEDVHRRLSDVLGELDTRERQSEDAAGAERRAGR